MTTQELEALEKKEDDERKASKDDWHVKGALKEDLY